MVKHIWLLTFLTAIIKSSDVIELTDDTFDEMVLYSDDLWIIDFYSPHCGHCLELAPKWEFAASKMVGKAKFGKVNAIEEKDL